jgi:sugar phosphate isomerase/epimerase
VAELIASYWTLAGDTYNGAVSEVSPRPIEERLEAAASAGFAGVGLLHPDLMAIELDMPFARLAAAAEDLGLRYIELECLDDWFTTGQRRAASDRVRADLLRAAEALGARHIKVVGDRFGEEWPTELLAKEFAELCREAAAAGAMVVLEPMAFTSLMDVHAALAVVEAAGEPNGKLLLDVWHVERAGTPLSEIADLPREAIGYVELNDAAAEPVGDLFEDTIQNRLMCGEGDLDLTGFLAAVETVGYQGPFGVEVISQRLRRRPLRDTADAAFATTANVIALHSQLPEPKFD